MQLLQNNGPGALFQITKYTFIMCIQLLFFVCRFQYKQSVSRSGELHSWLQPLALVFHISVKCLTVKMCLKNV